MLLRCVVVFVGSILQAQSAACMDHRDPRVSFETVIATKDPAKIRDKVVSLWPKGLCTVYIGLDTSIKESPKLQAFGAVDTSEKVGSHELNRRNQQAQLLQDYLILEVVYPAIEGRITAERAFATIDTLAGNPEGIFGDTRSQDTRCTIKTLKSLIYNRSPQLMDTAEATDPIIDTKNRVCLLDLPIKD